MEMGWRSEGDQREIGGRSHLLLLLEGEYLRHELVELDESERSLTAPVEPARGREGAWGVRGHEKCEVRGWVHGGVHGGCAWGVHGGVHGGVRGVCVEAARGACEEGACEDALCEHAARLALVRLHAHGLERLAQLARVDVAARVRVRVRVRVGVRAWPTRAPLRRCVRVTSWGRLRGLVRVRVEVGVRS